ncbi:MAG: acyltransferase [Oscillospiraceae bacterium]|nr:acyltransferase [Oscillospiraceae bacterium]
MSLKEKIMIKLGLLTPFKYKAEDVVIRRNVSLQGRENMSIGTKTYIGENNVLYAGKAPLTIGNYVMTGPNVTIITGDHRIDLVGEYMRNVTNEMKMPENDRPVVIEDDVWIGAGAIILKGVTIGRGSVISAGAIVRKDVPPYTIFYSHENIRPRFTPRQIEEHEKMLKDKYPEDFN